MRTTFQFYKLALGIFLLGGIMVSCGSGQGNDATNDSDSTNTTETTNNAADNARQEAVANISGTYADTVVTGKATFTTQSDGQVKLQLTLNIPARANKEVAVHLHEHGDCGDSGMASHGHWNPTNEDHGKWGTAPFHRGDIGNVKLDADGNGSLEMTTDLWQIGGSDTTKNILGKAVIVHGGVDDYVSQPTGNAGNRIGCGVIQ